MKKYHGPLGFSRFAGVQGEEVIHAKRIGFVWFFQHRYMLKTGGPYLKTRIVMRGIRIGHLSLSFATHERIWLPGSLSSITPRVERTETFVEREKGSSWA